jgi:CrcB protein
MPEGARLDDENVLPIDPDLAPSDRAEPSRRHEPSTRGQRASRAQPDVLLAIMLGGMLGATARYELALALPTHTGSFPWATFWTNISGSFVLGALLVLILERFPPSRLVRPFLATGVLGAYTTMSTFVVETALLLKDRHIGIALTYGLGSLAAGIAVAYAGVVVARLVPDRRGAGA